MSAGILFYRIIGDSFYYLCGHPGGPFWKKRDNNSWSIPKGLINMGELNIDGACREFEEETGIVMSPKMKSRLLNLV